MNKFDVNVVEKSKRLEKRSNIFGSILCSLLLVWIMSALLCAATSESDWSYFWIPLSVFLSTSVLGIPAFFIFDKLCPQYEIFNFEEWDWLINQEVKYIGYELHDEDYITYWYEEIGRGSCRERV